MFKHKIELRLVKETPVPVVETKEEIKNRINSKESLIELGKFVVIGTVIVIGATTLFATASSIIVDAVTNPKD